MAGESELDFIQSVVEARIRSGVYTMLPAKITKITSFENTQTVDVQPLIGRLWQDGFYQVPQEIENVPVVFPSAGGGMLSFPVAVGDGVSLLFSMRDIDNWSNSDGSKQQSPKTARYHALTDAIAIAGLYTKSSNLSPNPTDVELKFAGSSVKMKPDGDVTADVVKDLTATVAGDVTWNIIGNMNINSVGLFHNGVNIGDTHVHDQDPDSAGNTQATTEVPQ